MQPIQLGHAIRYLQGEEDGLTAMMHSAGAAVHKAWKPWVETPIVRAKGVTKDRVFEAIEELIDKDVLHMAPPSKHLMLNGISYEMEREEYEKYVEDSSVLVRRKLERVIASGRWDRISDTKKNQLAAAVIKNARKRIRARIKRMILRKRRRELVAGAANA